MGLLSRNGRRAALLDAVVAGDIGAFLPPSDPRRKGANSIVFVQEAMRHVADAGYRVLNVDSTLILTAPKIGPHATAIRQRLAELLNVEPEAVGVKAKTPEGLNLDNTAVAHVVVLLGRR